MSILLLLSLIVRRVEYINGCYSPSHHIAAALAVLPPGKAAEIFTYLARDTQERLIGVLNKHLASDLLNHMAPDDRTLLLQRTGR